MNREKFRRRYLHTGIAAMADCAITMSSGEIICIQCNNTKIAPEELEW